jgi:hypothetical protein
VYLELISFVHPVEYYKPGTPEYEKRVGHQWANKGNGFVAYAFGGDTKASPNISELINKRLAEAGSAYRYKDPYRGGRIRPDGVELIWEITGPSEWQKLRDGTGRPFYCADVTPRPLRVSDGQWASELHLRPEDRSQRIRPTKSTRTRPALSHSSAY